MGKFVFNLEAVLFQRQAYEEQCQRELAKGMRERMILLDQLRQMQQSITESKQQLKDGLVGAVDLDRMMQFARYSGQAAQRARAFVAKLAVVERQIDQARGRLIEASKAKKAMERLRERRYRQWLTEQERREAAVLDELGTGRFARRVVSGGVG